MFFCLSGLISSPQLRPSNSMASSLHHLLADEGFQHNSNTPKLRDKQDNTQIYICHDRTSNPRKNLMKTGSTLHVKVQPPIDHVAIKAVVSILSEFVGMYLKDRTFRQFVRLNFNSCFLSRKNDSDADDVNGVLAKLELGIKSVDELVECHVDGVCRMEILKDSIKLLTVVASLNSQHSKNRSTCGIPNTLLSASAQFYMAVVYKIQKNDRICARHLLQVFCDSPFMARTNLLPHLWDQFFLPHLLHLKVWYTNELHLVTSSDSYDEKEKMTKSLCKVYNDQMDRGTSQFASYYKKWLKVGATEPDLPFVPLPVRPGYSLFRTTSSAVSSSSTVKRSLYSAVFGSETDHISMDLDYQSGTPVDTCQTYEDILFSQGTPIPESKEINTRMINRSCRPVDAKSKLERQKVSAFQYLNCHSAEPAETPKSGHGKKKNTLASNDLTKAIGIICSSNSLGDCEIAVRVISKAWLESHSELLIQNSLSKPLVIVGILEVLFGSEDDEILELAISLLAELVSIKKELGQVILKSDPQLEIFIKLLKSSSLFLKASILLHLIKPTAKQMISADWIPLSLRVLEFGDQLQTLFRVRSSPEVAAFYFLEQLLTGFEEEKNLENARQVVSVGGLSLLVKRMEREDINEKYSVVSIIHYCLRADRSSRNYLVSNLNIPALFELLILGSQNRKRTCVIAMITDLLCLDRKCSISILLSGLLNKGGKLNLMQLLLVHLHRAPPEEQPFVAVVLLQLDLLQGDPSKYSVYRADAVEVIIGALKLKRCKEYLQEHVARALLVLGGRFAYNGDSCVETWLLKQAGFTSSATESIQGNNKDEDEEEAAVAKWQRKSSIALFSCGKETLMTSLLDSIASCSPALARACLVTVSWMTLYLSSMQDRSIVSMAVSTLMPRLFKCLKETRVVEERVLASLSILNLAKCSATSLMELVDENVMSLLHSLSSATWTASELISVVTGDSS